MYAPETEDMLPRAAPRPSAPISLGHTEEIAKPTVPEVSILFGQPPQQQQQQQPPPASVPRPTTFASWKKQLLPRVNFAPVLTTEIAPASPPVATPPVAATAPAGNDYNVATSPRVFHVNLAMPRQHLNINPSVGHESRTLTREIYPSEVLTQSPRFEQPRPSSVPNDVLTICAGTQTDAELASSLGTDLSQLVNKSDLKHVLNLLDAMHHEQQHLRRLCEFIIQEQQQPQQQKTVTSSRSCKETGTQCEILGEPKNNPLGKRSTPIVHDYIVEEDELPGRALPQYQSPRSTAPIAQSTGYRSNTPNALPATGPPLSNSAAPVLGQGLTKPSTEKSMVMNELALKYLPQRQINELMDDLHLSPKPGNVGDVAANTAANASPLRPIDNFHQSPSNISNASYVYLKKYRLLPEQRMPYDHHAEMLKLKQQATDSPVSGIPQEQQPMLDLDNIRNQPKLL